MIQDLVVKRRTSSGVRVAGDLERISLMWAATQLGKQSLPSAYRRVQALIRRSRVMVWDMVVGGWVKLGPAAEPPGTVVKGWEAEGPLGTRDATPGG